MPLGISTMIAISSSSLAVALGAVAVVQRRRIRRLKEVVRDGVLRRRLERRFGLAPGELPVATNWTADDALLTWLADEIAERAPRDVVELGSGLSTLVMALQCEIAATGRVTALEHEPRYADEVRERLETLGIASRASVVDAPLETWGPEGRWYARDSLARLPDRIDLLLIDGPPVHSGRMPRYPAGPELFPRLASGGVAVLDDCGRAKEKAALARFAAEFPSLRQERLATLKGAVALRRGDD